MNYYGQKRLDRFLYETYFKGKTDGTCMECGAYDGIILSNNKCLEEIGWKCINVEASPVQYARLVVNRPNSINVNIALSDVDGTSLFEARSKDKTAHLTGPSGLRLRDRVPAPDAHLVRGTNKWQVETWTYKHLIRHLGLTHLDLFVLDVEGWESMVIKGMAGSPVLPDVFCMETMPKIDKIENYEALIEKTFDGYYKKDKSRWINWVYIRR